MKYRYFFVSYLFYAIFHIIGCSSSTGEKIDITPPPVPSGLEITYTGNGMVKLVWENVIDSELKGYNVYWLAGTELDPIGNADSLFTYSNSVTISGLNNNILYTFGISSVDQNSNESAVSKITGKPFSKDNLLPPDDLIVIAENIDAPQITLSWSENSEQDLDHYNIYRALNAIDVAYSYSYITSVTLENYIDEEIDVGVNYFYLITAVEKGGWESASSSVEGDIVLPSVVIVSPKNFEYVNKTPTFLWQKTDGAKHYKIILKTSRIGGEIWNSIVGQPETQVEYDGETELIAGNTYYWEVGAISKTEINSISSVGSFVVKEE